MILLDTSGLLAAVDASERLHRVAAAALRQAEAPRSLSPFVLAELDYLVTTRVSQDAARRLVEEVGLGVYRLETFDTADLALAGDIMDRYRDLNLGLTDASILVLADRFDTRDVLTLDERHFRAVRDSRGRPLRIMPADVGARESYVMENAADYP